MTMTLLEAEKITNVPSSRTLNRHRKDGKITMKKDDKGRWTVDPQELTRVYKAPVDEIEKALARPSHDNDNSDTMPRHDIDSPMTKNDNEVIELRAELKLKTERIADKDKEISRLERTNQNLETRFDNLMDTLQQKDNLLLTYTKPQEPTTQGQGSNGVFKAITAVLILAVIIGAVLFNLGFIQLPTGQGGAEQFPPEITTPQQ